MFNFQGRDMRGASARVSRQGLSPDIGGQELPPGAGRGVRHGRLHRRQGGRLRQIRQQWQLQDGPEATVSKQWKKEQVWPFFGCCTADSQTDAGKHQLYNNGSLNFFSTA